MKKTLLLCFIHGFKGDAETFWEFPKDLQARVAKQLPDINVQLVVYPKYETKGDLSQSTEKFLQWLKEQVMASRREFCHTPWPPNDKEVGVVLVAHSMGGFVASDALFTILNDRWHEHESKEPHTARLIFPYIRGVLAFDTPYNGLARSMFVYGAFSQYQKVSNIWNIMSATSAGLMSARSMNTFSSASRGLSATATSSSSTVAPTSGWRFWQNVAFKSGTVGAIAAGGVAAYRNRETIVKGLKSLNRTTIKEGAESGYDALGQGLAYINRDSVGQSFAWLSSHLKFVGALTRQKELIARLERLASLRGVGVRCLYTSLGENGYWTGGYFVPERAFCAIPGADQKAHGLFTRTVNTAVEDEIQAHMSMFRPQLNDHYESMAVQATNLCVQWVDSDEDILDAPEAAAKTADSVKQVGEDVGEDIKEQTVGEEKDEATTSDVGVIEESPLDIAAAAAIPLPDAADDDLDQKQRQNYLQNLLRISQRAGSGLTSISSLVPSGATLNSYVPQVGNYVPTSVPSMSKHMPTSVWPFNRGAKTEDSEGNSGDGAVAGSDDDVQLDEDDDVRSDMQSLGTSQPAGSSTVSGGDAG